MKSPSSIYANYPSVVMYLNGLKYKVSIDVKYEEYSAMPVDAKVEIERTEAELTKSSGNRNDYYKFGGFPIFIQNPVEPMAENGKPYTYICTVQNDWGDMGNANVFVLIDDSGETIEDVYVESSCS